MNIKCNTISFELDARETRILRQASEILESMLIEVRNRVSTNFIVIDNESLCESNLLKETDLESTLAILNTMV